MLPILHRHSASPETKAKDPKNPKKGIETKKGESKRKKKKEKKIPNGKRRSTESVEPLSQSKGCKIGTHSGENTKKAVESGWTPRQNLPH